jgi:hypothetical protein
MLFNVSADPGETMDLAAALPGVVQDLTERLLVHKGRAVTAVNTDPAERVTDRRAHPSRNGGLFQPWLESDGAGGDAAQTSDTL